LLSVNLCLYQAAIIREGDPNTADQIWAVSGVDFENKNIATVDESGYFTVDLPIDQDQCMLLLVNTTAARKIDQIVGYIAIGVDAENNMLNFPSKYATGDIDLGTVQQDNDEGQTDEVKSDESSVSTVTASFTLTFDELKQIASNDKLLRGIKNFYANLHGEGDNAYWYGLNPIYFLYVPTGTTLAKNSWATPQDVLNHTGLEQYYQLMWSPSRKSDNPFSQEFLGKTMFFCFFVSPSTPQLIRRRV